MILGDAGRAVAEEVRLGQKERTSMDLAPFILEKLRELSDIAYKVELLLEEIPKDTIWEDPLCEIYNEASDLGNHTDKLIKDIEKGVGS